MRETITRIDPPLVPEDAEDAGDPVSGWRREWEQSVLAAEGPGGSADPHLAARRRDYGSYLFVVLDLVLAFIGAIVLSVPPVLVATALFAATGHNLSTAAGQQELQTTWLASPLFILIGILVADGAMALVIWYRLARLRLGWTLVGLGRRLRPNAGRAVLIGLGIGVVALVLSSLLTQLLAGAGLNVNGQDKELVDPLRGASVWMVVLVVLAGTFVAPALEELFFRGYVFRAIAVRKGVPLAYLISAGVFALFHLGEGLGAILPIVPVLFVIGLLLCFAYHRTGNLLADITAHAVNNGTAYVLTLLVAHH